jgi:hypothetical protein
MSALTPATAMATVIIGPEKRSRMMISFCFALCYCNGTPELPTRADGSRF